MTRLRRSTFTMLIAVLFLGGSLGGCAGAPLQQLSDARQAVRAAEKAGAEQYAPDLLNEARQLVESARVNLYKGEYRQSRDDADLARERAMEARRVAEEARGTAPAGP